MWARYIKVIVVISLATVLAGCASMFYPEGKTSLDRNWGKSHESTKQSQILHPKADLNLQPVVELDGKAGETVLQKYRDGFKGQEKTKAYNLNLGNVDSIGKGY